MEGLVVSASLSAWGRSKGNMNSLYSTSLASSWTCRLTRSKRVIIFCTPANALSNAFPKALLSREYYVNDHAIKVCFIIVAELVEWLRAIKWRVESIIKYSKAQFDRHTEEMQSRTTTSDIVVQLSRIFRARSARMSSLGESGSINKRQSTRLGKTLVVRKSTLLFSPSRWRSGDIRP